jgi:hypothetical protein
MNSLSNDINFQKIGEDIYIYNNFLSDKECNNILNIINSFNEDQWNKDIQNEWLKNRTGGPVFEIKDIKKRILSIINPKLKLGDGLSVIRMFPEEHWDEHSDNHDFLHNLELSKILKDNEPYKIVENTEYGMILYFSDFEGGELYYPNQGLEYKPKKGDLVIHSALEHCLHGVKKVVSGIRYTHSNNIYSEIKVPLI